MAAPAPNNRGTLPHGAVRDGSENLKIRFVANPTQHAFIKSRREADLFTCRVGEGKSAALAWASYYHQIKNPGADHAFCRNSYVNLERTTLKEFKTWMSPLGEYHESKRHWTWKVGEARGGIHWFGLDDEDDVEKLQSLPLGGILMDEVAPAGNSGGIPAEAFGMGIARLRQPGMNWYVYKLATNNPDETHWSYTTFVDPGTAPSNPKDLIAQQVPGFAVWKTVEPENLAHLPGGQGYYNRLAANYRNMGRDDLAQRFVEGKYGFQERGKPVTPEFNPGVHLVSGDLLLFEGTPIRMAWDFGHTPTCLVSQFTPAGHWDHPRAFVGEREGVEELIETRVRPYLKAVAPWYVQPDMLMHTGDPSGKTPTEASYEITGVKMILALLGGEWQSGPPFIDDRVQPAKAVLRRMSNGTGFVRLSRVGATRLFYALRGGWHYPKHHNGVIGEKPVKDQHSHPGDAFGYSAAVWCPLGDVEDVAKQTRDEMAAESRPGRYWSPQGTPPNDGASLDQFLDSRGRSRWQTRTPRGDPSKMPQWPPSPNR